ncbi:hypothetical protein ACE2AJ_08315 [Aquihabitans daechungensis]|uniref:hypothetical protein n=1 Tax=Aquihabitans daechungensis TaxID=1052257 RepID=UPI003B9EFB81
MPPADPAPESDRACLVLGGATHSTLAAIRSIARLGIPTYAGTLDRRSVPVFGASRACAGVRRLEAVGPEGLAAELLAFAEASFPTATQVLVISTSERAIDHLDAGRDLLDPRFELAIPPVGCCRALLDKAESLALAEQAGLQVPPWACVRTPQDVEALPELRFPVCVRPTAWDTVGARFFKIEVCATAPALRACLDGAVAGGGTFIVQEYVGDADDLDVGMVWVSTDGADVRTWTGRKRRSSSPQGGVLAWGETVDLPDVDAAVRAFAATVGYRSIGGIELLRSGDDLWFIEFNPRLEAFQRLGAISGFDAPALAAAEWLGRPLPPDRRSGSAAMWVGAAWSERLGHDRRGPGLFVADGLRFLSHRRHACSLWSARDPGPAFASVRGRASRGVRTRLGKVRRKLRGNRT